MATDHHCTSCDTVTTDRGHLCDPQPIDETCEYCNRPIDTPRHLCRPMRASIAYQCNGCGRVSDEENLLCDPVELPG